MGIINKNIIKNIPEWVHIKKTKKNSETNTNRISKILFQILVAVLITACMGNEEEIEEFTEPEVIASITPTSVPSITPTPGPSATATLAPSITPTPIFSVTTTPTPPATPTLIPVTATPTPPVTTTPTAVPTVKPTATPTPTPTPTPAPTSVEPTPTPGICSDPYPGYAAFCISDFEEELNTLLSGYGNNLGTAVRPNPPRLPRFNSNNPPTECSGDCALTSTDIENAVNEGNRRIYLSNDIYGVLDISRGRDVEIHLNDHYIEMVRLGSPGTGAERVHIVGPGTIGQISHVVINDINQGAVTRDLLIDGVTFSGRLPVYFQQPGNGTIVAERIGIVNSTITGLHDAAIIDSRGGPSATGTSAMLIGGVTDFVLANTNVFSGTPSKDDWGLRQADYNARHLLIDSWLEARGNKPALRVSGNQIRGSVAYSTPSVRDTNRKTTFIQVGKGNADATVSKNGGVSNTNVFRLFTRYVVGRAGFSGYRDGDTSLTFGPANWLHYSSGFAPDDALYLLGASEFLRVTAPVASYFSSTPISDFISPEVFARNLQQADPGETWRYNAISSHPVTFTDINLSQVPTPPLIHGGESVGRSFLIGSGSYD